MSLAAEFDSRTDRRAYALVAAGAAALSYAHARAFFGPFMGTVGASLTPLMLDAVVFWLASAAVRQARAGRPLPMLRSGAYVVLGLTVAANALGGATLAERVFLALPAALFGFLTEVRTRLALYQHRAAHGDDRLRAAAVAAAPGAHRAGVAVAGPPVRPRLRPGQCRAGPAARRPRRGEAGPARPDPGGPPCPRRGAAGTERRAADPGRGGGRLRPADPPRRARTAPGRADDRARRVRAAGTTRTRQRTRRRTRRGHARGHGGGHPGRTPRPRWPGCGTGTRT